MKGWFQLQLPRVVGTVVIMFVAFVAADIVVELLDPTTGSAQDSPENVFDEMKSSGYWVTKLVLSFFGGVLYGVLLWYLRGRRYSKGTNT